MIQQAYSHVGLNAGSNRFAIFGVDDRLHDKVFWDPNFKKKTFQRGEKKGEKTEKKQPAKAFFKGQNPSAEGI